MYHVQREDELLRLPPFEPDEVLREARDPPVLELSELLELPPRVLPRVEDEEVDELRPREAPVRDEELFPRPDEAELLALLLRVEDEPAERPDDARPLDEEERPRFPSEEADVRPPP